MRVIDEKIKEILSQLREAHKKSEKFLGQQIIPWKEIVVHDYFKMALAYDTENLLLIEYDLLLAQKYPKQFTEESILFLNKEKERLAKDIEKWRNRKF